MGTDHTKIFYYSYSCYQVLLFHYFFSLFVYCSFQPAAVIWISFLGRFWTIELLLAKFCERRAIFFINVCSLHYAKFWPGQKKMQKKLNKTWIDFLLFFRTKIWQSFYKSKLRQNTALKSWKFYKKILKTTRNDEKHHFVVETIRNTNWSSSTFNRL